MQDQRVEDLRKLVFDHVIKYTLRRMAIEAVEGQVVFTASDEFLDAMLAHAEKVSTRWADAYAKRLLIPDAIKTLEQVTGSTSELPKGSNKGRTSELAADLIRAEWEANHQ